MREDIQGWPQEGPRIATKWWNGAKGWEHHEFQIASRDVGDDVGAGYSCDVTASRCVESRCFHFRRRGASTDPPPAQQQTKRSNATISGEIRNGDSNHDRLECRAMKKNWKFSTGFFFTYLQCLSQLNVSSVHFLS